MPAPRTALRLAAVCLAVPALARPGAAQGEEQLVAGDDAGGSAWGLEIQVPLLSQYVFRGLVLNDEAVLQPEAFAYREWEDGTWFGVGVFANVELTDFSGRAGEITEWDYSAEGATPALGGTVSTGCAAYTFPDGDYDSTVEAFVAWERETAWCVPRFELWYDLVEADGFYARARCTHERDLGDRWHLAAEVGLGAMDRDYAAYNVGVAASGLADLAASVRLSWIGGDRTEISLTLLGSSLLDGAFRDAVADPDPVWLALTWGLAL
jgi:hypothetical protein